MTKRDLVELEEARRAWLSFLGLCVHDRKGNCVKCWPHTSKRRKKTR